MKCSICNEELGLVDKKVVIKHYEERHQDIAIFLEWLIEGDE